MSHMPVSVVVVSRGRPDALKRCLLGLSQLQYDAFEVVVVADPAGIAAADEMPFAEHLKLQPFDEPNISAARNLGLGQAAGEVVAFIDDDAVPEPQWLRYLIAPAEQSEVAAMGGPVRGRNGISFQWRARSLDAFGEAHDLKIDTERATVLTPPKGHAVKTEGTNMAFRRSVLLEVGGFDPAFHYFLDETDLNMRLARAGHRTALVPLAEVHHGSAENALRRRDRVPRDLFDIGASWAVFQRKHVGEAQRVRQWNFLRGSERRRLLRHMVRGALEPRDLRRLMKRLDAGYAEGQERPNGQGALAQHPAAPFRPFPAQRRSAEMILSRPLRLAADREEAARRVKEGQIITLLSLSPTALYHRVEFTAAGVWEQRGGLFGRSDRTMPLFSLTTRTRRMKREKARIALQRGLTGD
ncbi:MAG: glycosyltransferase family 2 protein [Sulfitobacter sp.]|nr:glycosyltransferase family 2 protein [Sulfitobacter sp.]